MLRNLSKPRRHADKTGDRLGTRQENHGVLWIDQRFLRESADLRVASRLLLLALAAEGLSLIGAALLIGCLFMFLCRFPEFNLQIPGRDSEGVRFFYFLPDSDQMIESAAPASCSVSSKKQKKIK